MCCRVLSCSLHYTNNLHRIPIREPYVNNRDNLFLWVLKICNSVNQQIGRPTLTRLDVLRIYFNNRLSFDYDGFGG